MNKTLVFEGAGWGKASSASDVGNCRIRTRIKNDLGEIVYLEMMGRERQKGEKSSFEVIGFIMHCHISDNDQSRFRKFENGTRLNWTNKDILEWVNKNLNCSFTSLDVQNEGVRVHNTKEPLC